MEGELGLVTEISLRGFEDDTCMAISPSDGQSIIFKHEPEPEGQLLGKRIGNMRTVMLFTMEKSAVFHREVTARL